MTVKHKMIYSSVTGKKIAEYLYGELVFSTEEYSAKSMNAAPMVMNDIHPYQSMVDGSMITSRSAHRAHLRQHGVIEVGNETKYLKKYGNNINPGGQKESIIAAAKKHGFL